MITPTRVFLVALILGVGTAMLLSWNIPLPPPEAPVDASAPPAAPSTQPAVALADGKRQVTADNLTIIDIKEGDGLPVKAGDIVDVNYVGRLYYGGKQFDASADHGTPLEFTVGHGDVIKGMDEGIIGMRVGGKRQLMIPSTLAYGSAGAGHGLIPGDAPLVFDLDLAKIQSAAPTPGPMVVPQP
jgi:peptidylprolyl isomerase